MKLLDMTDADRMAVREAIERTGCEIVGYQTGGMQVALPRPAAPTIRALESLGYKLIGMYHFPLGSDVNWIEARFRHGTTRYPAEAGKGGFWLFATVV